MAKKDRFDGNDVLFIVSHDSVKINRTLKSKREATCIRIIKFRLKIVSNQVRCVTIS